VSNTGIWFAERKDRFLDLLSSSPSNFFVPTLDIDLVWHTHQLFASQYKSHCETYVGRFINQYVLSFSLSLLRPLFSSRVIPSDKRTSDDKVDTFKLSNAFDTTCKAWKDRFGIQYTHCGCPSAAGGTVGKRLSRFLPVKKNSLPSPAAATTILPEHIHLLPPDTTGMTADSSSATHASEHSGVIFTPLNNGARWDVKERFRVHQETMKSRVDNEAKEKKKKNNRNSLYLEDGGGAHELAFLVPVPLFHPPPVDGGCVASNASVVNPAGACGNVGLFLPESRGGDVSANGT
jgi:Glycine-rich domain-containing protein-like